jgi:hypothetical protein
VRLTYLYPEVNYSTTYIPQSCKDFVTGTGPAADQLLADEQLTPVVGGGYDLSSPGNTFWALTDNENTVRDLATYSNGTTTVVNHRVFSAYGELLSQTNPQTNSVAAVDCVFAYTGRALRRFSENSQGGVTATHAAPVWRAVGYPAEPGAAD